MRRPAVVITLVLGALAAAYGAVVLLDLLARKEIRTSQALVLPAGGGLDLDTGSGDVAVEGGSGAARLEITTRHGLFGAAKVRVTRGAGGRMSVRSTCSFPSSVLSCGASLRVIVPASTAVKVDTGSGDVAVHRTRGGVVAQTGSGDVSVDGAGGPSVRLVTGSGDVAVALLAAASLQVKTGSGDVQVAATSPPEDVAVDTGSGDVELAVPDERYAVSTDTGSGDAHVTVRTDDGAARRLRVKTGSGDISVAPAG